MNRRRYFVGGLVAALMLVGGAGFTGSAYAQDGYHVGEGTAQEEASTDTNVDPAQAENSGPVRMARFSFVSGNVTWRPDPNTDWATATNNIPMREAAQIWVGDDARAEIQFDDGSVLRLGSGAVATLHTLFSDAQGEFTEIKLTDGLASMDLRTDHSIYQIDTPKGSVKSVGPSRVRVGVDDDVEIGVREGSATLESPQGKLDLHSGEYVDVKDDSTPLDAEKLPAPDSWDKFTDERHDLMTKSDPNVPESMRFVAGDMEDHGTWKSDADYGQVWVPQVATDWRPYRDGRWTWCDPFGWTWVGAEPWGWVPYHYGSWVHRGWGWCWVPGPAYQYWSPGVVNFSYVDDEVSWVPLAPWECRYPTFFGLGVWGRRWCSYYSVGFCGVWFAVDDHFCHQRPWNNRWVNRWHGGHHGDHIGRPGRNEGQLVHEPAGPGRFHPGNARFGTVTSTRSGFGAGGRYVGLDPVHGERAFDRGRLVGAPERGGGLRSGPSRIIPPTERSWTPTRTVVTRPEGTGILHRNVFRGNTPVLGGSRTGLDQGARRGSGGLGGYGGGGSSSPSDAARAARQSLGWGSGQGQNGRPVGGGQGGWGQGGNRGGQNGSVGSNQGGSQAGGQSRGQQGAFGGGRGNSGAIRGNGGVGGQGGVFGGGRGTSTGTRGTSGGQSRSGGWSIPDRGGWNHVHPDNGVSRGGGPARGGGNVSGGGQSRGGGVQRGGSGSTGVGRRRGG